MIQLGYLEFCVKKMCVYRRLPIELKEPIFSCFSAGQYRPVIQSQTSWPYWPRFPAISPSEFSYPSRLVFKCKCVCVCALCARVFVADSTDYVRLKYFSVIVLQLACCAFYWFFSFFFFYIKWWQKVQTNDFCVCVCVVSVQCDEQLTAYYSSMGRGWVKGDSIYLGLFRCKHFSSSKGDLHGHRVPLW